MWAGLAGGYHVTHKGGCLALTCQHQEKTHGLPRCNPSPQWRAKSPSILWSVNSIPLSNFCFHKMPLFATDREKTELACPIAAFKQLRKEIKIKIHPDQIYRCTLIRSCFPFQVSNTCKKMKGECWGQISCNRWVFSDPGCVGMPRKEGGVEKSGEWIFQDTEWYNQLDLNNLSLF